MRYLVSVKSEYVSDNDAWAEPDEPVVPWYPITSESVFLSISSFKKTTHAKIVELADLDIDALAYRLCKQYPGLPVALHNNYVMAIAKLAHMFPVGTKFRIFTDKDSARVQNLANEQIYTLWSKQPLVELK